MKAFYHYSFVLLLVVASDGQINNGYPRMETPSSYPLGSTVESPNGHLLPNDNLIPNNNLVPNDNLMPDNNLVPNDNLVPNNNEGPIGDQGSSTPNPNDDKGLVPLEPNNDDMPGPNNRDKICRQRFGYFRIDSKCDSYIECRNYRAAERLCPDGMNFNGNARWPEYPCGYPMDVPCIGRGSVQPPKPTAECPHQYGFYPLGERSRSPIERCSRYLMCSEGKSVVMNCPFGLAFDEATGRCDWPDQVPSCKDFLGFTCPARLEGDEDIVQNYKYSANECYYFWSCEQGRARLLSCDYGLAFDPASERCVNEDLVHCNSQQQPPSASEEPNFNKSITH